MEEEIPVEDMNKTQRREAARNDGEFAAHNHKETGGGYSHPGDVVGKIGALAYREHGPQEAARIFCSFKLGYDDKNSKIRGVPLDDERFILTIGHSMSACLDPHETKEIKEALNRFSRPLGSTDNLLD